MLEKFCCLLPSILLLHKQNHMIVSCNMLLFLYHRSSSSSFCSLHSLISEMSEEALLQEDPVVVRAANAIWDGNLTALGLELDEHGDLVIDSDELMKSEVVDISDPEGEEEEKELCDED